MARHRKSFAGERLSDGITVQLTPSHRLALNAAAAEIGMSPSLFARTALRDAVQSIEASQAQRQAQRAADQELTRRLAAIGQGLNQLAKTANQTRDIRSDAAIGAIAELLVATIARIEPMPRGAPATPERRELVLEVTRIGTNVMQLDHIARARKAMRSVAALELVNSQIVKTFDLVAQL